jgi:hypothetical protein
MPLWPFCTKSCVATRIIPEIILEFLQNLQLTLSKKELSFAFTVQSKRFLYRGKVGIICLVFKCGMTYTELFIKE